MDGKAWPVGSTSRLANRDTIGSIVCVCVKLDAFKVFDGDVPGSEYVLMESEGVGNAQPRCSAAGKSQPEERKGLICPGNRPCSDSIETVDSDATDGIEVTGADMAMVEVEGGKENPVQTEGCASLPIDGFTIPM